MPINTDLIPSWGTLDERLKNAPWYTVDGKHYGVPYHVGPERADVQHHHFPRGPDQLECGVREMNLPDGKTNAGRVQAYDGPIYIADAALYLMAHKPELGIKDPYELNEDAVCGGARPAEGAAQTDRPLLARCGGADRRLHQ